MTLYKGNTKIRDTNSYGVYKGSTPIGAIYKGSQKVYIFNKSTTYQAGTTLQAYQVSPYCTKIRVDCVASRGGAGKNEGGSGGIYTFYSSNGGGGGGGSSYTDPNLCTNVAHTQGYMNGAGYVKITTLRIVE